MPESIRIENVHDPRLSAYSRLRESKDALASKGLFVTEGRLCVQRLIASDLQIESVVVQQGQESRIDACGKSFPVYSLDANSIRQLVGFDFHRGILGCGRRPEFSALDSLSITPGLPPVVLGVIGVDQHDNLGSMIRTASALGINNVLVDSKTIDPYARRTIRVSMATVFQQRMYLLTDPVNELRDLQSNSQFRVVATTIDREATGLDDFRSDHRPVVLLVGSEANGLSHEIQNLASDRVCIPMELGTDSLNVSIAAAICMYGLTRGYSNR